ncbi:putative endonuclease V [Cyclospora cayetanensis]|uniref:Endonuclease V n=1 Tax=Cyclospora cayetanensis TaxID=88456 RepID=A0A1D3D745_9EIME|nr:putative endonuclease V [Cyclospora cayetanensis]
MLLLSCVALLVFRGLPAHSIASAVSARAIPTFLHAHRPPLCPPTSTFLRHYVAVAFQQPPGGSCVIPLKQRQQPYRLHEKMTIIKATGLDGESKLKGAKTEIAAEPAPAKRKHKETPVKVEEKAKDEELMREAQSSSEADKATKGAAKEDVEKSTSPAKKKRAAPKARAKVACGKKNSAAGGAPQGLLKPDEEFAALAALALKSRKFVGAHISAAGGVQNALVSCFNVKGKRRFLGCFCVLLTYRALLVSTVLNARAWQAFALFLKCQRKWVSPPLAESAISGFKERCDQLEMDKSMQVLPHGSYLINVANPDKTKQENAYNALLDDLQRCEALGIKLYNIHPGSTVGECTKEEGIRNIAAAVNRAHRDTAFVVVVLENMAGQKNVVGSKFEDLRDIINLVENKERVGVCLDTCHLFAAGYDIRTAEKFEKVMEEFDAIVGYKYLKGMHINDSKSELRSGLDRHELLGKGHLGLEPFKYIMQHPTRFKDMPLVLETPDPTEGSIWKKEIKQMYSFLDVKEDK